MTTSEILNRKEKIERDLNLLIESLSNTDVNSEYESRILHNNLIELLENMRDIAEIHLRSIES